MFFKKDVSKGLAHNNTSILFYFWGFDVNRINIRHFESEQELFLFL